MRDSITGEEIAKKSPKFDKPVISEQQKMGLETDLLAAALKQTFTG